MAANVGYERLWKPELVQAIYATSPRVELVLNKDSKIATYDGELNRDTKFYVVYTIPFEHSDNPRQDWIEEAIYDEDPNIASLTNSNEDADVPSWMLAKIVHKNQISSSSFRYVAQLR